MNTENLSPFRPFLSITIIVLTLFTIVFLRMEERRQGYVVLKLKKEYKRIIEEKRTKDIQLAKLTRPQLLEHVAQSKLTLKKVQANQVIHLSEANNDKAKKGTIN